ncbi:MAG: DEAD/DEAH box helicase [Candidatus Aenigmatarchaeota archaeon]
MEVEELKKFGFEEKWVERIKELGITKLYPPQEEFVKRKLYEKSCIVSSPTASGKTLLAFLSTIECIKKGKKVLYTSPLVSLAFEKYDDFSKFFKESKVAISVSDYDSSDPWLQRYDIIIATNEKIDSLIRHGAEWIKDVGLLIIDEIHLLNDKERGATLEIVIVKIKKLVKNLKILALSATIKNCKELAEWLNCELLESKFRPVNIYQGVAFNSKIKFFGKEEIELNKNLEIEESIVLDTLSKDKQILIFCSTRKNAESLAERLSNFVKFYLKKENISKLEEVSKEIENVLEVSTKQCKKLASCIKGGAAFHHSGLLGKQRKIIEDNFKNGLIKVLVSTTSLAYGVNLPAFRVLIRDIKRYDELYGNRYIPIIDYYQMIGRCGRPKYDKYGEAITIAKNEDEAEKIFENFINGEPEPIISKLSSEPALRMHILSLIASEFCLSKKSLKNFFLSTFFAHQYGDITTIEEKIEEILELLSSWNFIKINSEKLEATPLGKRISQLYLDPITGKIFVDAIESNKKFEEINVLQLISFSYEMKPLPYVRSSEIEEIEKEIELNREKFFIEISEEDLEFEEFIKSIKMAKILQMWINEKSEEEILEKFSITPGELYSRLQISDWLIYSLHEISLLLGKKENLRYLNKFRVRIQKGVKEELLPLVILEGLGRIRARRLYERGIKTIKDLKEVPLETLSKIIGENIAKKIKKQVEEEDKEEKQKTLF